MQWLFLVEITFGEYFLHNFFIYLKLYQLTQDIKQNMLISSYLDNL